MKRKLPPLVLSLWRSALPLCKVKARHSGIPINNKGHRVAGIADETIAIVGGGITGLFCAYVLAQNGKSVHLFEASDRIGGRIRSVRLKRDNTPLGGDWKPEELEFCAEFGPMRIELDKQLLLKALLDHLSITAVKPSVEAKGARAAYLDPFPPYASPTMASDPKYDLRPEEMEKTPLELLRTAMLRIMAHLKVSKGISNFNDMQQQLVRDIELAAATQEPVDPVFAKWMKDLGPRHYWDIQTTGCVRGVPLYQLGFWNLLSDYLSHDAITKLRDLGTFYHLLPENPNAAEWLVWWLLGFAISQQLQGIFGGMQCIVDQLEEKLKDCGVRRGKQLFTKSKVTELTAYKSKLRLVFEANKRIPSSGYDRVIFALPKGPTERIVHRSKVALEMEKKLPGLLDSAFGFPMVKLFVVVKNRWWEEANRANRYATRVPTRELHYWKGHTKDSTQGLIMLYTDRPASSFWANYVPPEDQLDVHELTGKQLPAEYRDRLKKKVVQYINENKVPDITTDDIVWYGIRDWGREPYGAANHAWRPERKYWVVMRRLADIARAGHDKPSIHVCGEAYSDYHGFIEGSLRSAVYVLHRILDKKAKGPLKRLPWLSDKTAAAAGWPLRVDTKYLDELREWAKQLDDIDRDTQYV